MYFDTKKKEFKINGKLSILKTKSMKMDYPNNVHLKDNDIFEVKKRFNLNPNSSFSREETIDKIIRETSPYYNGKRNENFKPPQIESHFVLGDEITKTSGFLLNKQLFKTNEANFNQLESIEENSSNLNFNESIVNSKKKYSNIENKIHIGNHTKSKSAMGNKDVKNFRTVKNTEYSDFLEKGRPTTSNSKLFNKSIASTKTTSFNLNTNTNEDDKKTITKYVEQESESTAPHTEKNDIKKSRNLANKLYKPVNKIQFMEIFGNNNELKITTSPSKTNNLDMSLRGQSFNIITCQEEVMNKSQYMTLNNEIETIHDKTKEIAKRTIEDQIKNRENISKKISASFVNERENSKLKLTDKLLNNTFEIKDIKYEGIKKRIKKDYRNSLNFINKQFMRYTNDLHNKYIDNYENFTIEEEPNVKQVKECKIEKIKNFSPNLNKYKTKFLSKTIEKTITNKDQSLSTSKREFYKPEKINKNREENIRINHSVKEAVIPKVHVNICLNKIKITKKRTDDSKSENIIKDEFKSKINDKNFRSKVNLQKKNIKEEVKNQNEIKKKIVNKN